MAPVADPYQVLGLPTGLEGSRLSVEQIKAAYRAKVLKIHPDKRPVDEADIAHYEFQRLQDSFNILKDPEKREEIDSLIRNQRSLELRRKRAEAYYEAKFREALRKHKSEYKYEHVADPEAERKRWGKYYNRGKHLRKCGSTTSDINWIVEQWRILDEQKAARAMARTSGTAVAT